MRGAGILDIRQAILTGASPLLLVCCRDPNVEGVLREGESDRLTPKIAEALPKAFLDQI